MQEVYSKQRRRKEKINWRSNYFKRQFQNSPPNVMNWNCHTEMQKVHIWYKMPARQVWMLLNAVQILELPLLHAEEACYLVINSLFLLFSILANIWGGAMGYQCPPSFAVHAKWRVSVWKKNHYSEWLHKVLASDLRCHAKSAYWGSNILWTGIFYYL